VKFRVPVLGLDHPCSGIRELIDVQQTSATGDYEAMSTNSQTETVGWPDQTARSWDDSVGDRF
jgi:hypothetical protein